MPTSFNILKDINITVDVIPSSERMASFKSTIKATVHCLRELTGTTIATIDVYAFAHSHSREQAIISAINEILQGNYNFTETVHHSAHYAELDYSQVHSMESHNLEEYADLFHKHFDLLKFSLPGALRSNDAAVQESSPANSANEEGKG